MAKRKTIAKRSTTIDNLVVVSDLHCGCRMGLCPDWGATLDDGGTYKPSKFQLAIWSYWQQFWAEFVPDATRGEPFAVVCNGDALDGVHHNSTTQISNNLADQAEIAYQILSPIVTVCEGRYYHVRGTEAHVGKSAVEEERLAKRLGAIRNKEGQFARYDLWKRLGDDWLVHLLHHIGTTGSHAYEATAVHKELTEAFAESARWGKRPPDVAVRSHRHRYIKTEMVGARGAFISVVTPAWQGKTPFAWRIPGARQATPQFGGIVVRAAHGRIFVDPRIWTIERSESE